MVDRPTLRLRVADPHGVAARVAAAAGVALGADGRTITLRNAILVFTPMDGGGSGPTVGLEPASARRAPEGRSIAPAGPPIAPAGPPIAADVSPIAEIAPSADAIGWATVDLARAARELEAIDGAVPSGASNTPDLGLPARDARLGARLLPVGRPSALPFDVVLLEPDTEGPLAAALARHGEGPAVVYLRAASGIGGATTHVAGSRFGPWVVVRTSRPTVDRV